MTESKFFQVDSFYDRPFKPFFLERKDFYWAGGLFLLSLILYLFTLTPRICAGDSGELTTAIYNLGAAHPPGYPLYTMLGKIFTYIPVGTIAYRVNLLSAVFAALTIPFLFLFLVKLLQTSLEKLSPMRDRIIAAVAGLLFAVSQTNWSQAVISEVYALNIFFAPLLLFSILVWQERVFLSLKQGVPAYGERLLLLFALLMGMSLTNHLLLVGYMLPLLLFIVTVFMLIRPAVEKDPVPQRQGIAGLAVAAVSLIAAGIMIKVFAWDVRLLDEQEALLTIIAIFIPILVLGSVAIWFLLKAPDRTSFKAKENSKKVLLGGGGFLTGLFLLIMASDSIKQKLNFMKTTASFNILLVFFLFAGLTIVVFAGISLRKNRDGNNYYSRVAGLSFKSYLFFLIPMLLYLTLLIRANAIAKIPDPPLSWGETADASRVINHFLRKQYPKNNMKFISRIFEILGGWGQWHLRQFTPWLLLFVPFGIFAMFRRNKLWLALSGGIFVIFNFLLLSFIRFRVTPRDLFFPEVFFIPSYVIVADLDRFRDAVSDNEGGRPDWRECLRGQDCRR